MKDQAALSHREFVASLRAPARLVALLLALSVALAACKGEPAAQPEPEPGEPFEPPPGQADGDDPFTVAGQSGDVPRGPRIEPEPASVAPAGPVDLPLTARVDEYGPTAANDALVAVAYRIEAEGEQCIDNLLERCHRWFVTARPRDGAGDPVATLVGEGDSPSGIVLETLFATPDAIVAVTRQGRYTGDRDRVTVSFIGADAALAAQHDVLVGASREVDSATAAVRADGTVVVCWSGDDQRQATPIEQIRDRRIWCRDVRIGGISPDAVRLGAGAQPHRAPVLAWHGEDEGMLAWVRGEVLEVLPLDGSLQPRGEIVTLGPATPRKPALVAGHGGFLLVWQHPSGSSRALRIEADGQHYAAPVELGEQGIRFVTHSGVAVVPGGFLVAGTPDSWSRLVLIDPRGESSRLVTSREKKQLVRLGDGSALELGKKRNQATWRAAASVVEDAAPADVDAP